MSSFFEKGEPAARRPGIWGRGGPGGDADRMPPLPLSTRLEPDFGHVHDDARFSVSFMRTLRIPDDGRDYPLPAGLGRFPMARVGDLGSGVPRRWRDSSGVVLPMYQSEATWLSFDTDGGYPSRGYPFAVKVLAGGIDAVSGEDWQPGLVRHPQNYVVVPEQPWLDGFCVAKGRIRQFVAEPLGEGRTVEERLTGTAKFGGLQLVVTPMKAERWEEMKRNRRRAEFSDVPMGVMCSESAAPLEMEMGLGAGGSMLQEIYEDPHDADVWDERHTQSCFVRIVQAQRWEDVTGRPMPHPPISMERYAEAGIPWFGYFDADLEVVNAGIRLEQLDVPGWSEAG